MARFVLRRLGWAAVVVATVTLITFVIFYVMPPGDPAARFAGRQASPETVRAVRAELGLDQPVHVQFGRFTERLVTGDEHGWPGLGFSYDSGSPVRDELLARAPRTLWLAGGAAVLWLVLGVAVGVISALRPRTVVDRVAMGIALVGISTPVFWLGLIALYVFWQQLGIVPGTGYVPLGESVGGWLSHLVLPWIVLASLYAAIYARLTRSGLLDALGEDFVRTARAKGVPERRVVLRHGLRAGLTPIVTLFGIDLALLIGGAVITEKVFNIQGLGSWVLDATARSDLPVVLGVTLVVAVAVALASLLVDVLYAVLDPRVRAR